MSTIIQLKDGTYVDVFSFCEDIDEIYEIYVVACDENGKWLSQGEIEDYIFTNVIDKDFFYDEIVKKWKGESFDERLDEYKAY